MIPRIARHVRGNIVAYAALFLALCGTAIALPAETGFGPTTSRTAT
jgi:hypothetical protein